METILFTILIWWILGWVAYCVCVAMGVDFLATLSTIAGYAWWAVFLAPAAYVVYRLCGRRRPTRSYEPGDHVVYLKQKFSPHPGPRAEQVRPIIRGEGYAYFVRKPWTVVRVLEDQSVEVVTNRGKRHVIPMDDPRLHKPTFVEWLLLRLRWQKAFPEPAAAS